MQAYVFHSFHLDQLLIDSAFIYVDWEYWVSYLNEIASNSNATTTKFEIYNDDNFFGYKYEYNWVDPSNDSIFENQLKTVIYDKQRGNIVNFDYSLNLTNSVQEIENAYSYQFVSVSMDLGIDDILRNPYIIIGALLLIIILVYLIYWKVKKELSKHKLLETS